MKRFPAIWLAAALALTAAPLHAQTLFGLIPDENPQNGRDAYRMRVRAEVMGLLGRWKQVWDADDIRAATDLWTRDGVLVEPGGDMTRSRDSVRVKLQQVLESAGSLRFSVMDFDMSGDMAYVRGAMAYSTDHPSAGGGAQTDSFVLIARRQRDDVWLIRSLTLIPMAAPAPAAPTASAPQGASASAAPSGP